MGDNMTPNRHPKVTIGHLLALLIAAVLLSTPVAPVMISTVKECIDKGGKDVTEEDCQLRSHTNIDVRGGEQSVSYVLRNKDKPNSGLYIHIQTSTTTLAYNLAYVMDVPKMYREHNGSLTYSEVAGKCDSCDKLSMKECTKPEDVPPQLRDKFANNVCCACGKNVSHYGLRQDLKCSGIYYMLMMGKCVSLSCLEVVGPWYSIYRPTYPPEIHRRIFIDVYKFDGDENIIPDVAKIGYYRGTTAEDKRYLKEAVYENNHFKCTMTTKAMSFKNDELDFKMKLISQQWVDGNAPKAMGKYVAIPTWPETDEDVKGSTLKYNCDQKGRPEFDCKAGQELECRRQRCALNARMLDLDAVDTTGTKCDKIGVSLQTWGEEGRLCNSAEGSCIQNQMAWYLHETGDKAHLPKLYGAQPMIVHQMIKKPDVDVKGTLAAPAPTGPEAKSKKAVAEVSEWENKDMLHSLAYSINHADTSRIEFDTFNATITQIIAEAAGFIVSAKIDGPCKLASEEVCRMHVITKNVGRIKASFSHRVRCYDISTPGKEEVANSDEQQISVEPNKTTGAWIPLTLLGTGISDEMECNIDLFSSTSSLLETVTMSIGLIKPKVSMGMDVTSMDQYTRTEESPSKLQVDGIDADKQCICTGFAVACFFSNFKSCMGWAFNKYYTWFIIGISVLSFMVLLPVLIPLTTFVLGKIKSIITASRAAARQRRAANNRDMSDNSGGRGSADDGRKWRSGGERGNDTGNWKSGGEKRDGTRGSVDGLL
ncbi:generative cell specific protein, putative [Babesia ovis]|uniref:Generative cell specific protein, putative n=1 Tax=Babesia ovis TaxID=5869 RepID=A0A9W5WTV8_BABOV|nr:generative cell specific protein, putative [Babesia ovis]